MIELKNELIRRPGPTQMAAIEGVRKETET